MWKTTGAAALLLCATGTLQADGPPTFFTESLPSHAIGEMLAGYGTLQGEGAALDAKTRELVALAVAAQIPCEYCVHAHRNNLAKLGASEAEMREAVSMAGYVRLWSTALHGVAYDLDAFRDEHDEMTAGEN